MRILTLALDRSAQTVRQYLSAHRVQFPVALDDGVLRPRLSAWRFIPMNCVVDRAGRLRQSIAGEMSEEDVLGLARTALRSPG